MQAENSLKVVSAGPKLDRIRDASLRHRRIHDRDKS